MDVHEALDMWVSSGLLDDAHARRLAAAVDDLGAARSRTWPIRFLVLLGAVLVGGGLLLFIGSHWGERSPTGRVVLLLTIYGLVVGSAVFATRRALSTSANGLWFLSTIVAGVNIFLLGQIFNLPLAYWQGTGLWMLVALAMGVATGSSAQGWLVVPLGVLTVGWIPAEVSQQYEQWEFLVEPGGLRPLLPLLGIGLIALGSVVATTEVAFTSRALGAFGALFVAVPLTSSALHPEAFVVLFEIDPNPFHAVIVVASLAAVGAAVARRPSPVVAAAAGAVTMLLVSVLPQSRSASTGNSQSWLAEPLENSEALFGIYTAIIFALAIGAVILGRAHRLRSLVNAGFGTIGVLTLGVYVTRLAGTLPTALAVLAGGALLISAAVLLERKRRDILAFVPAIASGTGR